MTDETSEMSAAIDRTNLYDNISSASRFGKLLNFLLFVPTKEGQLLNVPSANNARPDINRIRSIQSTVAGVIKNEDVSRGNVAIHLSSKDVDLEGVMDRKNSLEMAHSFYCGTALATGYHSLERRTIPFYKNPNLLSLMSDESDVVKLMTVDLLDSEGQQIVIDILTKHGLIRSGYNLKPSEKPRGFDSYNEFKSRIEAACTIEALVVEGQHRFIAIYAMLHKSIAKEGLPMKKRAPEDRFRLTTSDLLTYVEPTKSTFDVDINSDLMEILERKAIERKPCQMNTPIKAQVLYTTSNLKPGETAAKMIRSTLLKISEAFSDTQHNSSQKGLGGKVSEILDNMPPKRSEDGRAPPGGGLYLIDGLEDGSRPTRYDASKSTWSANETPLLTNSLVMKYIESPLENVDTMLKKVSIVHPNRKKGGPESFSIFPPMMTAANLTAKATTIGGRTLVDTKAMFYLFFFPLYYFTLCEFFGEVYSVAKAKHVVSQLLKQATSVNVSYSPKEKAALAKELQFDKVTQVPTIGTGSDPTSQLLCASLLMCQLHLSSEIEQHMDSFKTFVDEIDRLSQLGYDKTNVLFYMCKSYVTWHTAFYFLKKKISRITSDHTYVCLNYKTSLVLELLLAKLEPQYKGAKGFKKHVCLNEMLVVVAQEYLQTLMTFGINAKFKSDIDTDGVDKAFVRYLKYFCDDGDSNNPSADERMITAAAVEKALETPGDKELDPNQTGYKCITNSESSENKRNKHFPLMLLLVKEVTSLKITLAGCDLGKFLRDFPDESPEWDVFSHINELVIERGSLKALSSAGVYEDLSNDDMTARSTTRIVMYKDAAKALLRGDDGTEACETTNAVRFLKSFTLSPTMPKKDEKRGRKKKTPEAADDSEDEDDGDDDNNGFEEAEEESTKMTQASTDETQNEDDVDQSSEKSKAGQSSNNVVTPAANKKRERLSTTDNNDYNTDDDNDGTDTVITVSTEGRKRRRIKAREFEEGMTTLMRSTITTFFEDKTTQWTESNGGLSRIDQKRLADTTRDAVMSYTLGASSFTASEENDEDKSTSDASEYGTDINGQDEDFDVDEKVPEMTETVREILLKKEHLQLYRNGFEYMTPGAVVVAAYKNTYPLNDGLTSVQRKGVNNVMREVMHGSEIVEGDEVAYIREVIGKFDKGLHDRNIITNRKTEVTFYATAANDDLYEKYPDLSSGDGESSMEDTTSTSGHMRIFILKNTTMDTIKGYIILNEADDK